MPNQKEINGTAQNQLQHKVQDNNADNGCHQNYPCHQDKNSEPSQSSDTSHIPGHSTSIQNVEAEKKDQHHDDQNGGGTPYFGINGH